MNPIENTQQITILPKGSVSKDDYIPIPVAKEDDFKRSLIIITTVVILTAILVFMVTIDKHKYEMDTLTVENFEVTEATVTDIQKSESHRGNWYWYYITVMHTVDGIDYSGFFEYPNKSDIESGKIKVGDTIKIYVKPNEPQKMSLIVKPYRMTPLYKLLYAVMLTLLGMLALYFRNIGESRLIKEQLSILNDPDAQPVLIKANDWYIYEPVVITTNKNYIPNTDENMRYNSHIEIPIKTETYKGILKQKIPALTKRYKWHIHPKYDDIVIWIINPENITKKTKYYIPFSCKALSEPYKGVKVSTDNEP